MKHAPHRVRDLFVAAAELPDAERSDFLCRECGSDAALQSEVRELLDLAPTDEFLEPPELDPLLPRRPPTRFGPYVVSGRCAGDDDAWLAADARGRRVRVEVHAIPALEDDAVTQFVQRAYAAAAARLPRTIPAVEHGRTAAGLWIAMEDVEGQSLRTELEHQRNDGTGGPCLLPPRASAEFLPAVARFTQELATALGRAHAQGLAHGRVDVDRVRIDTCGGVRLAGFGIAALHSELALPAHDASGLADVIDALRGLATTRSALAGSLADVADRARRTPTPPLPDLARELGDLAAGRMPPAGGFWQKLKKPFRRR